MIPSCTPVCKIDVSLLRERLEDSSLFGGISFRKDQYPHSEMDDIWVRYNHSSMIGKPELNDNHDSVWYPIVYKIPEVFPIALLLMSIVGGERLGAILITKLPPGGEIKPHIDGGWHAGYYDKYYVPIKNDIGSKFCWDDIEIDPREGEVWKFDNSRLHWVKNESKSDRISMIVCIRTVERSLSEVK